MLENERYNKALEAATSLREDYPNVPVLPRLLEEQYLTQLALRHLETTSRDLPERLPFINALLLPENRPPKKRNLPLLIEVGGMPESGKSTCIRNASETFDLYPLGERAAYVKRKTQQQYGKDWTHFIMERSKIFLTATTTLMIFKLEGSQTVIADRDLVDTLILNRAYSMDGRLIPPTQTVNYYGDERTYSEPFGGIREISTRPDHQYALILCLTTPRSSLKREGVRIRPGRVMNLNFLNILYEQYLRFHSEVLKIDRNFPYICLDLSSNNFIHNQEIFNSAIKGILKFYNKLYSLNSERVT